MRALIIAGALIAGTILSAAAQGWGNSNPYTYQNFPYNNQNNPYNSLFNSHNSPSNYQNPPLNGMTNRGIYDNSGNRLGYGVVRPDGGTSYYDNSGRP